MRFYETTIVLSPQADDATIEKEIDKVTQTVTGAEGELVTTQKWGVKRMAYPVMDHAQAYYIHFVYQSPPSVPGRLESMFRINENILRHLTILVEGPLTSKRTEVHAASAKPAYEADRNRTPAPAPTAVADQPAESAETPVVAEPVGAPAEETAAVETADAGESTEGSE